MKIVHESLPLEGRVALVTGGARGIGFAIAESLIEQGSKVVIVDNGANIDGSCPNESILESSVQQLGTDAKGIFLDIGSLESAQKAVEFTLEKWGRLDIVVNNAAILRDHFIFKARPSDFDEVIRVNLAGAYYTLAAAAPVLRNQSKNSGKLDPYTMGRVINIVSTAGFYGNYGQSSYASAKSGLLGLTRAAALDLARTRITVNAVAPFARSRVTEIIVPANEEQAKYKERALRISPDYVAKVVCWLCSDSAQNISGQLFGVRGREVMLFSQPRPTETIVLERDAQNISMLRFLAAQAFEPYYSPLTTDLEVFNIEPLI